MFETIDKSIGRIAVIMCTLVIVVVVLLVILFSVLCCKQVSKNAEKEARVKETQSEKIIDLEEIAIYDNGRVFVDHNTDVLYFQSSIGLIPMLKANGECVTYSEYKEKK